MAGRGIATAVVLLLAGGAAARPPDWNAPCELARVDRGRMPSLRCIACHGDTADAISPGRGIRSHNHPVEVEYAGIAAQRPGDFRRPALLPSDVPLVDGKLACTSCHDGRSPRRGRVVDRADLCTTCHLM